MAKPIYIREKLSQGKVVIGTWSNIPSPIVTDIITTSGVDFVVIDCEHGPLHFETVMQMVIVAESNKVSPAVRVSGLKADEIQKALDIGAHCVHIPNISTFAEAVQCVDLFKFPPLGSRGFSPFTRSGGYGNNSPAEVIAYGNKEPLLAIHIEDARSVENIEKILEVPEIDILFLGLYDLSKSLGIPGEITHPKLLKVLEQLSQIIRQKGKYPGTIVMNQEQLKQTLDYGIQYITYSVDCSILKNSYKKVFDGVRFNK